MDLLALGKDPIRPDEPTGSDVRYEPEFEQLQAEIDKLSVPSSSGSIDWQKVTDLASVILAEKSKDLLVASYLAVSQVQINQMEGLRVGLNIIQDLMDQHWENLFPSKKRMRGRLSAIEWWIEKTESALENLQLEPIEKEKLEDIVTILARIDTLLKEHLPEPPLLRPIQRYVEKVPAVTEAEPMPEPPQADTTPQPQPESQVEPAATQAMSKPAPATAEPVAAQSEQDAQRIINSGLQHLNKAAAFLFENNLKDPQAYRLRRMAAWAKISALPPAKDGQTRIPPPAAQTLQQLEDMRNQENWNALLESAEQMVSQFILWIDLNRFVAESLVGLGEGYQRAHDMVCQETAFFLYRFTGLDSLAFSDGTPFADSATKQWLKSIELGAGGSSSAALRVTESVANGDEKNRLLETIEKSQNLAKKNQLVEAIQLLQYGLQRCISKKESLLWRMALCQLLTEYSRTQMALPHLELILKDIDAYHLDSWDPGLALQGLKVVWTGFNNHKDEASKNHADAVFNRISELDPVAALGLVK